MSAFFRRRKLTIGAAALLALAMIATLGPRFSNPVLATSDDNPYTVAQVVDDNPDPNIVETTIVAEAAGVDVGIGRTASVLTFNGTIPGPEFRLKVGDTVIVHFKNQIAHATGIHWHGIELANASDGTPLTQNMVPPGETFLYKFIVTRPGIYWYHPHHHSSTNQVFKGMYGSIIVTDAVDTALQGTVLPSAANTRTLVLSDLTVCRAAGSNDTATYDPALPHVSGAAITPQSGPAPKDLCEAAPDGEALDEDGAPRGDYASGDVPNIQKPAANMEPVNEGQTVLTNGMNVGGRAGSPASPLALAAGASTLNVQPGQGLRFQIVNAATTRFFRLTLRDGTGAQIPLVRVGGEGGLLDAAVIEGDAVTPVPGGTFAWNYTAGEVLLDPGDRVDVVATVPVTATAGQVLTMWTQDFQRTGGGFARIPTVPVAHLSVTGGAVTPYATPTVVRDFLPGNDVEQLPAPTITLLDPAMFMPAKPGLPGQEIELNSNVDGLNLGINNKVGTHDFPGDYTNITHEMSARYAAAIGGTLQLTVKNVTSAHHPFHLHGFSLQPISLTKTGGPNYTYPYREFRDNIDVPKGYTLTFRVRLDDRPLMDGVTPGGGLGRWVFHCHIFFHAVFGMISEFDVVAADGNEKPYVNADETLVEGNTSDTLTVHGTYKDPDGDPVTLSANVGTVSDDGDGVHWTWTQTGAVSGFVYITGSDGTLSDQAAFKLKVNAPPVLTVPGPQSGAFSDPLTFGISATDPDGDPIILSASGLPASLGFVDNGNGTGTVTGVLTAVPAIYVATFTATDSINDPVHANVQITVTKETTVLQYTGPTVILNGGSATLSATLTEDDGPPVAGKTVNFTLGAQACSGVTNAAGSASCSVVVSSPLGESVPITVSFAGDAFYLPSGTSATAIVFAFPSNGAFVAGDTSAAGGSVTFWSHSWSNVNALSGGAAPSAFKGFAGTVTLPTTTPVAACGSPWSTLGGNSPPPTATVPSYMGTLVSSAAAKSGSAIAGNTVKIVVVKVNPGYGPNPGSPGTGTVIATFCQ